jgi:hypothetical protein
MVLLSKMANQICKKKNPRWISQKKCKMDILLDKPKKILYVVTLFTGAILFLSPHLSFPEIFSYYLSSISFFFFFQKVEK